jgi:tripartite-type tricarboxylate transporter receptor subunit TctC
MNTFKSMITGVIVVTLVVIAAATAPAMAQDYPNHPIRIISPYAPGGATDILPRLLAPKLQAVLGQPIIVENKPGANGNIGTEFVAKSKPDGYTLLMGNNSGVVINQNIYKLNIKPSQDLAPVILVALVPSVLYVNPSVPATTLAEFVALAKKNPNKYSFASAGSGSPQHLSGEMLKLAYGLDLVHIPYKGSGPAMADVVAGQVPVGFDSAAVLLPFVESKSVRPLATTGEKRSIALPNVPTMMESGLAGFNLTNWYGLFAPAGTPKQVVDRLNGEIRKILSSAEFKDRIAKMGSASVHGSAEDFRQFIAEEVPRWAEIVKKSNARVD